MVAHRAQRCRRGPRMLEQLGQLLAAAKHSTTPWLRPLITVAVNTGLRRSELLNLRWSDVDLERRILTLRETKDGTTGSCQSMTWCGSPCPPCRASPAIPAIPGIGPTVRLDNIKRSWATALAAAGISDFRFHDRRHTFASHLVIAGVN